VKLDVANPLVVSAAALVLVFVVACSEVVTIEGRMVDENGLPIAGEEVRIHQYRPSEDGTISCFGGIVYDEEAHTFEVASPHAETDDAGRFVIEANRATFEEGGFCVELFRPYGFGRSDLARLDGEVAAYGVPRYRRVIDVGEITIVD